MDIEWSITKKRGNMRPILNYSIILSEFEKDLGMLAVRVESTIPKPPDAGWTHCWPGQNERGDWRPEEFYLLMTPSHKTGKASETLKLPWRQDNAYPEVEQSFMQLREAFERVLVETADSPPMRASGNLETSGNAKRAVAPAFAAGRILQVVKA
ncbi:MAG: hypothetical protein R6W92_07455 [Desulfocurvibacter africanus]